MPEIIGIDHIYISVSELDKSAQFYDRVLLPLGFRKNEFELDAEWHIQYYNRHFGYVLRPARRDHTHDAYAVGLHHFCLRVDTEADVRAVAEILKQNHIPVSTPRYYLQYAPDYYAIYFSDPDGLALEITNYRQERRQRHDNWDITD